MNFFFNCKQWGLFFKTRNFKGQTVIYYKLHFSLKIYLFFRLWAILFQRDSNESLNKALCINFAASNRILSHFLYFLPTTTITQPLLKQHNQTSNLEHLSNTLTLKHTKHNIIILSFQNFKLIPHNTKTAT
jgi:hypothetical protein